MKAVILAGGFGKRLRPLTEVVPKPLIEVKGKPIIQRQIEWLKKYGIDEFVILVGYLKEKIIEFLGSGEKFGVKVSYVVEDRPLGTGGALKNAEHVLKNEEMFLVLNGDILTNLNPLEMINDLDEHVICVIASVPLKSHFGVMEIDENNKIKDFKEKPVLEGFWMNAGIYLMKPEIFKYLPKEGDIEKITFPLLAKEGKLKAHKYTNVFWKSIDTYKDIEEASEFLSD